MKTKQLLLSFMAVAIIGGTALFFLNDVKSDFNNEKRYQVREANNSVNDHYGAAGAAQWLHERRVNPETGVISEKDIAQARKSFEASELTRNPNAEDLHWAFIGPDDVGGRTRAFIVDNRDNSTLWAGGVAGGLWKSSTNGLSWIPIALNDMENINISSMCQDKAGNIYVGTGESFTGGYGTKAGTPGFVGAGIWKSTDGITFNRLESTENNSFLYVNELICDPLSNDLYTATGKDLYKSVDGGDTWVNLSGTQPETSIKDVVVTANGTVVYTTITRNIFTPSVTHVWVSFNGEPAITKTSQFDTSLDRIEFAVAPSDPNMIYALCSYKHGTDEKYFNLYQSKDGGENWLSVVKTQTATINVFGDNNQGGYDNVISVYPNDPGKVILGGIDLWTWSAENDFEQISFWVEYAGARYVHADQHKIVFHPDYEENGIVYFTNDGGIFISNNGGSTFVAINKNYGVTQYIGIDCGPKGQLLGGTQDNGTPYIDLQQYGNPQSSVEFTGGDGGYAEASELYPGAIFSTIYYCTLTRSNENGAVATQQRNPFDSNTFDQLAPGNEKRNPFVTPIDMWESFDYDSSKIYIPYIIDTLLKVNDFGTLDTIVSFEEGHKFFVKSTVVRNKRFEYAVTAEDIERNNGEALSPGDTIPVREKFASLMAIGGGGQNASAGKIYITRNILDFNTDKPQWDPLVSYIDGEEVNDHLDIDKVSYVKWAPDGNSLYAIASNDNRVNSLYRFTGIKDAYNYVDKYGVQEKVTVYDQREIDIDTVYSIKQNELFNCDTILTSELDYHKLDAIDVINEDYTYYEVNTDNETFTEIYDVDTIYQVHHYNVNLVSFDFETCGSDTVKNVSTDSLTLSESPVTILLHSISTTNLLYENIIKLDTVQATDPDTLIDIISKIILDGQCVIDTVKGVNNDTMLSISNYEKVIDFKTMTTISNVEYSNLLKIDTLNPVNDTLINIAFNNLLSGCNADTIKGINVDTVTDITNEDFTRTVYSVVSEDDTYINVLMVDTIQTRDTTLIMGGHGEDMVWSTREINTVKNVVGTKLKSFGSRVPTSIAIDPNNVDKLIVTIGGYTTENKLYYTENATTATGVSSDFTLVNGVGLPDAPVYASLISDPKESEDDVFIFIGTEFGVYSTTEIDGNNTQWQRETGIPKVAVLDLVQQLQPNGYLQDVGETGVENSGIIYAGTHGLGAWEMTSFEKPFDAIPEVSKSKVDALSVKVYPNPVKAIANIEYAITNTSDVKIEVYSLTGKLVYTYNVANQYKGTHTHKFNTELLSNGVYIVSLTNNNERKVSKIVVE